MSSLLDGIDVAEKGGSQKNSGGPNPKVIKGVVAAVLFLIAGVILAIQFNVIPSPFGESTPKNQRGEAVEFTPTPQDELERQRRLIDERVDEYIRQGNPEGGA